MDTLINSLSVCESLLRKAGDQFWADMLLKIIQKGSDGDQKGMIEDIVFLYGGAGSFNDLIISHHNDHTVDSTHEGPLNTELNTLRADIYEHAIRLRRL